MKYLFLLLAIPMALACHANAAITFVSSDAQCLGAANCSQLSASATSITCTLTSLQPGDAYFIVGASALGNTITFSDGSNTYTSINKYTGTPAAGWNVVQFSYVKANAITGTATITVTENGAATKMACAAEALRGTTSLPLDVANEVASASGATALSSPTITAAGTTETMVGFFFSAGSGLGASRTVTAGTGYTVRSQSTSTAASGAPLVAVEDFINSGTTSNTATATLSGNTSATIGQAIAAVNPFVAAAGAIAHKAVME